MRRWARQRETSIAAHASIRSTQTESQRAVLALFERYGAMDDTALVLNAHGDGIKQSPSGLRSRRAELVAAGLLRDSRRRVKLPTGRQAIVWERCEREFEQQSLI